MPHQLYALKIAFESLFIFSEVFFSSNIFELFQGLTTYEVSHMEKGNATFVIYNKNELLVFLQILFFNTTETEKYL